MTGDKPDFVAVGHVTRDITERGPVAGGSALYASIATARLGWRAGLLTSGAPPEAHHLLDELDAVVNVHSEVITTFENRYSGDVRSQVLHTVAPPIDPERLPAAWRGAPVVLLAPVFREVPAEMAQKFPSALLGMAPQGWLRKTSAVGRITSAQWHNPQALERADVVILSERDLPDGRIPESWLQHGGIFVLTRGQKGAHILHDGSWRDIPAYPSKEVDPTGAGDVFAAAFLIRYFETSDARAAGQFASCAASLMVEGFGPSSIPARCQVEQRMSLYPGQPVRSLRRACLRR